MNQFGIDEIKIKDLLTTPYYNIGCILMAAKGNPDPLIHFHGEGGAFAELKQVMDYKNFIRNVDFSTYPIGLTTDLKILRPHNHVASALLAGKKSIYYMSCRELAPDYGESWLSDYEYKDQVIDFWQQIPSIFDLNDPDTPQPS